MGRRNMSHTEGLKLVGGGGGGGGASWHRNVGLFGP